MKRTRLRRVGKKKRRKRVSPFRKLEKEADKQMSLYVRKKTALEYEGLCPFCRRNPIQDNFHFFRRGKSGTRWTSEACIGSCKPCNGEERWNPQKFSAWFIRSFGHDKFLELEAQSRQIMKFSRYDLEMIAADFKKRYEDL